MVQNGGSPAMDKDPFDLVGDVLDGQFRVDSFAGEGDLSVVYKGHHLGVDAPVAIKCLNLPLTLDATHATPLVDGFKDASRIHYRLARGNLNIAQSIASGSTVAPRTGAAVPSLVREWFHGESLSSDLARRRANKMTGRSVAETMALLEAAFDGVSYAHHQGEVHLSLNPNNLFLATKAEGGASLKVLDFGVASAMTDVPAKVPGAPLPPVSRRALRVLFPAYAAPEQLDQGVGPQGPWTDVYALALITLEVLSDRVVMSETDTGALVEHALDDRRRPNPQAHGLKLPRNLELVLTRAVLRSPDRRPKNAAELWRDMKSAVKATASRANMLATEGAGGHTLVPAGPVPGPALRTAPAPTATPVVVPAPGASAMMQVSAIPSAAPSPAPATLPSGPRASAPSDPVVSRSRSATLMGIAAPAVVVGAVGNRLRVPSTPSVETQPMSFEPISSSAILSDRFGVEPVTAVNKAPPAVPGAPVAPLPEMTPSPPAPYAALDPARVPPVAPMADFDDEGPAARRSSGAARRDGDDDPRRHHGGDRGHHRDRAREQEVERGGCGVRGAGGERGGACAGSRAATSDGGGPGRVGGRGRRERRTDCVGRGAGGGRATALQRGGGAQAARRDRPRHGQVQARQAVGRRIVARDVRERWERGARRDRDAVPGNAGRGLRERGAQRAACCAVPGDHGEHESSVFHTDEVTGALWRWSTNAACAPVL